MKTAWTIAWREFKTYFTSPIGYIVIAFFLVVMGFMFFNQLAGFIMRNAQYSAYNLGKGVSITDGIVRPMYGNLNLLYLFTMPLLAMRLFAEERKNHTLELLLTSPVQLHYLVIGKFLSAMLFLAVALGATLIYPLTLYYAGNPDPGPIITSYIGTFLLCGCYIALGAFFSAMTENLMIAFCLTFFTSLFLWIISWPAQMVGSVWGEILQYLSVTGHLFNFTQGVINTPDVMYYLSFIGIFLMLAHRVLDSFRWR